MRQRILQVLLKEAPGLQPFSHHARIYISSLIDIASSNIKATAEDYEAAFIKATDDFCFAVATSMSEQAQQELVQAQSNSNDRLMSYLRYRNLQLHQVNGDGYCLYR